MRASVVLPVVAAVAAVAFVGGPWLLATTGQSPRAPVFGEGGERFGEQALDSAGDSGRPSGSPSPGAGGVDEATTAPQQAMPRTEATDRADAADQRAGEDVGSDGAGAAGTSGPAPGGGDPAPRADRGEQTRRGSRGGSASGRRAPGSEQAPDPPATGRYAYAVDGWESTSAPGSRRDFPATATVVVHDREERPAGTAVTLDLTYSDSHEERMLLRYGAEGVALTFEGGEVSFFGGTVTQTSQARYVPPMVRVPGGAEPGDSWSGSAEARSPEDDSVVRKVTYRGRVTRREQLEVAGRRLSTLVVEWRSEFTGSESGWRRQTLWFSPELGIWVKRHDRVHAERFRFAYDKDATLTLRELPR